MSANVQDGYLITLSKWLEHIVDKAKALNINCLTKSGQKCCLVAVASLTVTGIVC